jgi:hypothetical protein
MPEVVDKLKCPDCGGPLKVNPGDAIVTCGYCGSDVNLAVGSKYFLRHSIVPAKIGPEKIDDFVRGWMGSGFLKPSDLARKHKVLAKELQMIPLFIIHAIARTEYEGMLTRAGRPVPKKGTLEKEYYWKVLGRRASAFPTREYEVPLAAKADFEIAALVPGAKFLNSEIAEPEAISRARQEMEANQRFLLEEEADTFSRLETRIDFKDTEFIHVSAWFITYQYRGRTYSLILDGATGEDIKAEIPQAEKKGIFGGLLGG